MIAHLEIEAKETGFVTCVEVLLSDGSLCFWPKREIDTSSEVVAVVTRKQGSAPEPERRPPARFERVVRMAESARRDTGYYEAKPAACTNNCDSDVPLFCNGRRSASRCRCVCACHGARA